MAIYNGRRFNFHVGYISIPLYTLHSKMPLFARPLSAPQYHSLLGIVQVVGRRNPGFSYRFDTPFEAVCECIESK